MNSLMNYYKVDIYVTNAVYIIHCICIHYTYIKYYNNFISFELNHNRNDF